MAKFDELVVVVPAYNPNQNLIQLIDKLSKNEFVHIIVVNDGSKEECYPIFEQIKPLCHLLHHAVNLGKGRALKTAFNYYLNHYKELTGIVTVDADDQHTIEDITNVALQLYQDKTSLIMGVRDFSGPDVPFRSKFGNILTRNVLNFSCGIKISDSQTGLRGIPTEFIKELMNVNGERFEFETNMLLHTIDNNIQIKEIPIQTIYIEKNKSSHFNPIVDSVKIYSTLLKYLASSLASFGVDILSFYLFIVCFKSIEHTSYILIATIGSRVLSSLANFIINKKMVFKSTSKNQIIKYFSLSIVQMFLSGLLVSDLYLYTGLYEVICKIIVDSLLFILSFLIQREWVFKK